MREIKFRIWNTEEYYYTDPEHLGEYHFGIGKGIDNASKDKIYNTKEWVWQQFTGLKDKKGKEIYEGDLLKVYNNRNGYLQVEFVNAYVGGWVLTHPESVQKLSLGARAQNTIEVIGNIYENPELLS